MDVRILLLQARVDGDPMAAHEHRCFVERTGVPAERVVPHNLCDGPPSLSEVKRHDAVMVGGSGDFYVTMGNLPQAEAFNDLLREIVQAGHPMFASCFGFQSMVLALGAEVIHDPDNTEVGTYDLTLTEAGHDDPLFGNLPREFRAQMGHKERATSMPEGLSNLAASVRSPLQALRIPDKPIWASQFHPELDRATNLDRFRHYLVGYAKYMPEDEQKSTLERFQDSTEASALLSRFLELVFP